ncbi:MAG: 3-dehydroquinate synthase [Dehalococcoidia bacterium]
MHTSAEPEVRVETDGGAYDIVVRPGCLDELGPRLAATGRNGAAVIVADVAVAPLHAPAALDSLTSAGFRVETLTIPEGEPAKTVETAAALHSELARLGVERADTIVALGGGVTGDIAGFVAATYLRGIALVQVPTSLLAMADAAIGGKTGVNLPEGKNLVGAFHQPLFVLEDPRLLATMRERSYREGWAEVIKHGLIADPNLLELLEKEAAKLAARDELALTEALVASARVKAEIVSVDERESDKRMWLNYGHTFAHGLEVASGYGRFLHGEAVSIGMMAAAALGNSLGLLSAAERDRHARLLGLYELPLMAAGLSVGAVLEGMTRDKKRSAGRQRWVLLDGLANPVIRDDVPETEVLRALAEVGVV